MARNEEKSQSMLFRFREAQAAELGLSGRTDRRPRLASTCTDLRQCERWRGEILRDISRKVSKIQDAGLTDYEIRDLNDEINKLLREKHHWEKQIVSCGGANYKRAAGKMTDGDGREVPGARGYKYFGRAKELPGVKELFQSAADDNAELESYKTQKHDMFMNQGPEYYGDFDETSQDSSLLAYEQAAEAEAWEEALEHLRDDTELLLRSTPSIPKSQFISLDPSTSSTSAAPTAPAEEPAAEIVAETPSSKRKASSAAAAAAKKAKLASGSAKGKGAQEDEESTKVEVEDAVKKNGFMSILKEGDLKAPKLLTMEETEKLIVALQKKALLEEYGA